ncbi:RNase adaptor protein RapZ [Erysipelotrichaceae bacterium MTC7]|nr:RNase adaptor protein RapZ [Erysipelotrichaceae bacterium MTC7]
MEENKKQNIILVTGMSGAGKTSAIGVLEDMGYHCIDMFPVQLLDELGKIISDQHDPRYQNIAFATSAQDYQKFLSYFEGRDKNVRVVYLDASNEELLRRYKFTRRSHPLIVSGKANTLEEAIEAERDLFNDINYRKVIHIDTTKLSIKALRQMLESRLALDAKDSFVISFVSFGYKNGVPLDADLMFDVRFLPNPYWIESMRNQTGDDQDVYEFVMEKEATQTYLQHLLPFLDYSFEQYKNEGKNHLTVTIGCTGGQHRSVTLVNYLFDYYRNRYKCHKGHRDKKVD